GNKWKVFGLDGGADLKTAGSSSHLGYGNLDAEFVAFESCYVVPSPIEVTDWWSNWTSSNNGIFDGLHQAMGFHTVSWQSTDQKVTDYFGSRVKNNYAVWQAWFDAINAKGKSDEHGSAVMHPSADGDRYGNVVSDPPQNHTSLRLWYQH